MDHDFILGFPPFMTSPIAAWSNVDPDYPEGNALSIDDIVQRTQMVDTTGFQADFVLQAGVDDLLIAIDHVNFTTAEVKVDSSADFSTAQTFSRNIGANAHTCWYDSSGVDQDRLKDILRVTGSGLRYVRLTVAGQAATDGSSAHFVGRIIFATRLLDCHNPDWGMVIRSIIPFGQNERKSRAPEKYSTGLYQYAQLSMRWEDLDPAYMAEIRQIGRMRPDQTFLVWNNVLSDAADFYAVQRDDGELAMSWDGEVQRTFGEMSMTEAI